MFSFYVRLIVAKGVSRFRIYSTHIIFLASFIIINLLLFTIFLLLGLKLTLNGFVNINLSDILKYSSMWIIGEMVLTIFVLIFSMILKKRYVVFIVSTGFFAIQRYDFIGKWFHAFYNPMVYASSIYFMPNRPPMFFLCLTGLIVIVFLVVVGYRIFKKSDLSILWL